MRISALGRGECVYEYAADVESHEGCCSRQGGWEGSVSCTLVPLSSPLLTIATIARPEQLILQDDPSFLPGLTLPPPDILEEFSFLDPVRRRAGEESQTLTVTPLGSQTVPRTPQRPLGRLVIPSSSSGPVGGFGFEGDNLPGSVGDFGGMMGGEAIVEPLPEDFSFDGDGNFIDLAAGEEMAVTPQIPEGAAMHSDAGASARVRAEHEAGQQVAVQVSDPTLLQ